MEPLKDTKDATTKEEEEKEAVKVVNIFKKKKRNNKNLLKRPRVEIDPKEDDDTGSAVVKKAKTSNTLNTFYVSSFLYKFYVFCFLKVLIHYYYLFFN